MPKLATRNLVADLDLRGWVPLRRGQEHGPVPRPFFLPKLFACFVREPVTTIQSSEDPGGSDCFVEHYSLRRRSPDFLRLSLA
jgi:hypothetical protein